MNNVFRLLPEQASTLAPQVDAIYIFLVAISVFFTLLAAGLVLVFGVRFRRRAGGVTPERPHEDSRLELAAGGLLLVILLVLFGWGAKVYFAAARPPADAMEILVTGKQWMWKLQHPNGKREINTLHIPAGKPIQLTMTSEDVIHSFYIPAFRVKQDVLPGRYTRLWFQATKPGKYRLFCTEYCGTEHSMMGGWVYVLTPADYEKWLVGQTGVAMTETPVQAGERLFVQLGCQTCHNPNSGALGPNLVGVFGHTVRLADGTEVIADEDYLRESILNPQAKIVAGYAPVMPVFKGIVTEDQLMQLVAYIKSLAGASN
ncbi:MAG: cytochrome c oxidase subunit II [Kiritimatiellae bacterium]|nr:cytochrome c oxidase subunit II [Kiritimatiellia bacterium]MDW8459090.1 cytochrome c oxidase subunit II [Verrucomicrobiota bacterium]